MGYYHLSAVFESVLNILVATSGTLMASGAPKLNLLAHFEMEYTKN